MGGWQVGYVDTTLEMLQSASRFTRLQPPPHHPPAHLMKQIPLWNGPRAAVATECMDACTKVGQETQEAIDNPEPGTPTNPIPGEPRRLPALAVLDCSPAQTRPHARTHTHAHAHARTRARAHTHAHTHTHTHTPPSAAVAPRPPPARPAAAPPSPPESGQITPRSN